MKTLRALLGSKKWITAVVGIIVGVIVGVLPDGIITPELKAQVELVILGVVSAYVLGQGWADSGKSAEQIRDKRERDFLAGNAGGSDG